MPLNRLNSQVFQFWSKTTKPSWVNKQQNLSLPSGCTTLLLRSKQQHHTKSATSKKRFQPIQNLQISFRLWEELQQHGGSSFRYNLYDPFHKWLRQTAKTRNNLHGLKRRYESRMEHSWMASLWARLQNCHCLRSTTSSSQFCKGSEPPKQSEFHKLKILQLLS
jgi:beta-xylosidase